MPGLKDVKNKIKGIGKTAQITKTMYMVASAKLRSAQKRMEDFRPYTAKFTEVMRELSATEGETAALPLMEERAVKTVELLVITSDRGLAGSFNSNILRAADRLRKQYEADGKKVSVVAVGKKASRYFRKLGLVRAQFNDIMGAFQMFNARDIAQEVTTNFLNGGSDRVEIIYGKYYSMAVQKPEVEDMLPIKPVQATEATEAKPKEAAGKAVAGVYTFEPDSTTIMTDLLPLFLNVQVYHAMLEVGASEQAARMTAMDNATKACKDMIRELTMLYNKARQAAVTNELLDIVGGAEALKG